MADFLGGLLGDSFDDPRTTGNLAMAQGLLSDPRAMRGLASGLLARQEGIRTAKQQQLQDQMQALQVSQMQQKQALIAPLLQGLMGGQGAGAPGPSAAPMGGAAPAGMGAPSQSGAAAAGNEIAALPPQQRGTMLRQFTPDHIAAIKMAGGPDLMAEWKAANEGFERKPGSFYDMPGGWREYVGDPTKGVDFKNGQVSVMPGAADTQAALARATAGATEGAKASLDLVDWTNPTDGQTYKMTREQLAGMASGRSNQPSRISAAMNEDAKAGPVLFNIGGQRGVVPQGGSMPTQAGQASPIGVGVASGQTPAQLSAQAATKDYGTTAAKNAAEYENSLNSKVVAGRELVRRVNEQENLLNQFKTGATAPVRSKVALWARDLGAPETMVQGIANGDPSAAQEFTKFAAQTNLEQLKQAIGANRMLKTEFDAFQEANPSIASDPAAIRKVFKWLRDTYSNDFSEQQALAKYKKSGADPADFASWYSQQQHDALMNASSKVEGSQTQDYADLQKRAAELLAKRNKLKGQ